MTTAPPLIGITAGNDPQKPEQYVLRWDYVRSVEPAGGIPVVLAPSGPALHPSLVNRLDGLVVTGGVDIEPVRYGEAPHPTVERTSAERDEFELLLLHEALKRDMPVLAICRGMQLLNVVRGGSLLQDIPSATASTIDHNDPERPRTGIAHSVSILVGSALHGILGAERVEVNSFHHQAAKRIGEGLVPVAFAEDGIVEALELPGARFVLGVQWHPESFWREPGRFGALFRAFVTAARSRAGPSVEDSGVRSFQTS